MKALGRGPAVIGVPLCVIGVSLCVSLGCLCVSLGCLRVLVCHWGVYACVIGGGPKTALARPLDRSNKVC
jgi:hypothetical protein